MRKFERITVDPKVMNGLACIRDTGITVSDVVCRIKDSHQLQEVVSQHPQLQIEDVVEALLYAVDELVLAIAVGRSDGINPLNPIMISGEIIADLTEVITDEDRAYWGQTILEYGRRAADVWFSLGEWASSAYGKQHEAWAALQLSDAFEEILRYARSMRNITLIIPDNLPPVRSKRHYLHNIINIFAIKTAREYIPLSLKSEVVFKVILGDDNHLTIHVHRPWTDGLGRIPSVEHVLNYPGSLGLAAYLIKLHGSNFQIRPTDEGITFEFQLPIWQDPQP